MGQPRGLSNVRELVSLVAAAPLALEVGEVGAGMRPADGVRSKLMCLPNAHHEVHGERQALLLLQSVHGNLIPGFVDGDVGSRHHLSEVAGTVDHRRRRDRREKLARASRHARDTT